MRSSRRSGGPFALRKPYVFDKSISYATARRVARRMQCTQGKTLGRSCHGGTVELSLRRTRTNMIIKAIKTTGLSIALAATFLVAAGSANAFAQDGRGRDRDRDGRQEDRRDRDERQDSHRDRDDRQDNHHNRDEWRDNHFDRDEWRDNRWERFEERRGYRDGLILGREDALEHRRFNPFRHHRFRSGSSDYREAFRIGYARAYRRFADNYGRRYGRGY